MASFGTLDPTSYTLVWRDSFTDNSGLDQAMAHQVQGLGLAGQGQGFDQVLGLHG